MTLRTNPPTETAGPSTVADQTDDFGGPVTILSPRSRQCLRCQTAFPSQWAGERICGRCKGTTAWRSGTPMQTPSVGRRR